MVTFMHIELGFNKACVISGILSMIFVGAHEFVTDIWAAWGQGSHIKRESPLCVHGHFGNKIVRIVSVPTQKSYLEILSQEKTLFRQYI